MPVIVPGTSICQHMMRLVQELLLRAARFKFSVTAKHVPGKNNGVADALSRFQMQSIVERLPETYQKQKTVPLELLVQL